MRTALAISHTFPAGLLGNHGNLVVFISIESSLLMDETQNLCILAGNISYTVVVDQDRLESIHNNSE